MKSAMMHTGNACIRLICILCVVVGCYSQTCGEGQTVFSKYSPIVTGFTCQLQANGQYTYQGQHQGSDLYNNSNNILLFRPSTTLPYRFGISTTITSTSHTMGTTESMDIDNITSTIKEKCVNSRNSANFQQRPHSFDPNPVSTVCLCGKGFGLVVNLCTRCDAGKYKSLIGNSACLDCLVHSNSPVGSTACTCNDGYMEVNPGSGECTPCSTGVVVGCYSQTCGQVFFTTYSPTVTGLTCRSSLNGQYTFLDHFSGAERYINSNGVVLFKPDTLNSYVFAEAHTSNCERSISCPWGYTILARTNSFVLNASGIRRTITERCLASDRKTFVWNDRASAFLPNAVSQCTCDKGRAWSGSVCVKCNQGEYKSLIGRSECTPCSKGTYQANTGSAECIECPWGEYSTTTGAISATSCMKCDFQNHPRSDGGGCEGCAMSFEASVLTSASSGIAKRPGCIEFVT